MVHMVAEGAWKVQKVLVSISALISSQGNPVGINEEFSAATDASRENKIIQLSESSILQDTTVCYVKSCHEFPMTENAYIA